MNRPETRVQRRRTRTRKERTRTDERSCPDLDPHAADQAPPLGDIEALNAVALVLVILYERFNETKQHGYDDCRLDSLAQSLYRYSTVSGMREYFRFAADGAR